MPVGLLVVLVSGGLTVPLSAQTPGDEERGSIEGRVTNAETAQPISGARVAAESAAGEERQTLTDRNGNYRLGTLAPGRYVLRIEMLGHAAHEVAVDLAPDEVALRDVSLALSPLLLDEIVATGTAVPTARRAIPNAVTVVTADDIARRGVLETQDLFRGAVPGLFHSSGAVEAPSGRLNLYSRGTTSLLASASSPPKIYVDGVQLADPGYLQVIDPHSIERIEVLPGPQASTIYGSEAMNGIVQIFLKRGEAGVEGPQFTATLSGGTIENNLDDRIVGQQDYAVGVRGTTGDASYNVSASYSSAGPWMPGRTEQRRGANGGFRLGLGRLTADVTAHFGTLDYEGYSQPVRGEQYLTGRYGFNPTLASFVLPSGRATHVTQQTLAITVLYDPVAWWQHRLTVGRDQSRNEGTAPPQYNSARDTTWESNTVESIAATLSYQSTLVLPVAGPVRPSLTAGLDYTESALNFASGGAPSETGPFNPSGYGRSESATWGGFAQSQVDLWDVVYLTAGLRAENNELYGPDYGINLAPRFGATVVRELGPVTAKLRGAYGRATKPPTLEAKEDEFLTDSYFGVTYHSIIGNREIRPEFQRGSELGLDLELGQWGSLQITRFDQTADDLILSIDLPPDTIHVPGFDEPFIPYQSTYVNIGTVRTRGWEAQARVSVGRWLFGGTFSTAEGRVVNVSEDAPGMDYQPGDRMRGPARATGAAEASYQADRWRIGVQLSHTGPIYRARSIAKQNEQSQSRLPHLATRLFSPVSSWYTGYETNSYRTVDLDGAFDLTPSAQLFVRVYNAGNYGHGDYTDVTPVQGRRVLGGARVQF